jgi:hypothetical protein
VILQINPERGIYAGRSDEITALVEGVPLVAGEYDVVAEIQCDMYGVEKMITDKKKVVIE